MSKSMRTFIVVVILVLAGWWLRDHFSPRGQNTMEYHGREIKLSKHYASYEDYKDDPGNIAQSENARVQKLVMEAPIGGAYAGRPEMTEAVFSLRFPGFGLGAFGGLAADGGQLSGFSVEIPRADKVRVLLFHEQGGKELLVDDFVAPAPPSGVREENGSYLYSTKDTIRRPVKK
jgi:hypothetical protein